MVDKLPQPELAARYRASHVLLLTSLREGFNQATLDALSDDGAGVGRVVERVHWSGAPWW